jgi:TatD DNase family protein
MDLVDSHAHVDFPQFNEDRDAMLARAREAGIRTLLAIGIGQSPDQLDAAIPFAEKYDWIYASVGIHPHEAAKATDAHFARLSELARHPRVIALGEIGLDYHYDFSPRGTQHAVFLRQMEIARGAKLPIIIHCREAWPDCLALLAQHWRGSGIGGVLHCFSGTLAEAQQGIDMGFQVSFAGNCTYPKTQNLRDVARALPLDSLFIETDSPYLAPQSRRGKRNEPAFVAEVARTLASVRDLPCDEFAAATSANFRRFFRLAGREAGRTPGA